MFVAFHYSLSIYTYGTENSIFVEIPPDSTNIKNDPRIRMCPCKKHFKVTKTYQAVIVKELGFLKKIDLAQLSSQKRFDFRNR